MSALSFMTTAVLLVAAYALSRRDPLTSAHESVVTPLAAARAAPPPITTPPPREPIQDNNEPTRYRDTGPRMAGGSQEGLLVQQPDTQLEQPRAPGLTSGQEGLLVQQPDTQLEQPRAPGLTSGAGLLVQQPDTQLEQPRAPGLASAAGPVSLVVANAQRDPHQRGPENSINDIA